MWIHKYLIKGNNLTPDLLACYYHMFNLLSTRPLGSFLQSYSVGVGLQPVYGLGFFYLRCRTLRFTFDLHEASVKSFLHFVSVPLNVSPTPQCINKSPQFGVICELSLGMF